MSGTRGDTFATRAMTFFGALRAPRVPAGVRVMNPYRDSRVRGYVRAFLAKFFDDNRPRTLILGINPGRFGAGVTGTAFTDPVALADFCGIPNHLPRRRELSSVFIYDMIDAMGGPSSFYRRYFITAACPLGFTRRDVNLNYYDEPALRSAVTPFMVRSIERHLAMGGRRERAIVLGAGANAKFLRALNDAHGFFGRIDALDHPRFIMQYRRKRLAEYLGRYADTLEAAP